MSYSLTIPFTKLDERARTPTTAYDGDAGYDLFVLEDTAVPVGVPIDVRTGIAVAIPDGFYGRIIHRSSAPRKRGLMVLEGIIDSGFRGELFACAYAWDMFDSPIILRAGDSIAQLIVQEVRRLRFTEGVLPDSARGTQGFGSSGH